MFRRSVEQLRTFKPYHHIPRRFRLLSSNNHYNQRHKESSFLLYLWKARRRESTNSATGCNASQETLLENQSYSKINHSTVNSSQLSDDQQTSKSVHVGDKSCVPSASTQNHNKDPLYLHSEYCSLLCVDNSNYGKLFNQGLAGVEQLCRLPAGVNYHEWLISNECSFFANINLVYHSIREYCTNKSCPNLSGYSHRQLSYWVDEKGRKLKCAAQQHMDLALAYVDKILSAKNENDDDAMQTNQQSYGFIGSTLRRVYTESLTNTVESCIDQYHNLPITNPDIIRQVVRSLLKVMCHIYHAHFDRIVQLKLHQHLNSVFLHFMVFNLHFMLLEVKDSELLNGLFHSLLHQATKEVLQSLPANTCTTCTPDVAI